MEARESRKDPKVAEIVYNKGLLRKDRVPGAREEGPVPMQQGPGKLLKPQRGFSFRPKKRQGFNRPRLMAKKAQVYGRREFSGGVTVGGTKNEPAWRDHKSKMVESIATGITTAAWHHQWFHVEEGAAQPSGRDRRNAGGCKVSQNPGRPRNQ